ncbi:hypothetical protein TorRG33x02_075440 [Trema orientale]|uniref:Uncharacterized protein n=1 Tax=Trema orientale TaxID=63057 RepID=A0A2P5FFJ1_TREOI|nr:hypothetical protein TorRG33x02_075440 [Trema orientale]
MGLNPKSKPRFISKNLDKNLDLSLSPFFLDLFVILQFSSSAIHIVGLNSSNFKAQCSWIIIIPTRSKLPMSSSWFSISSLSQMPMPSNPLLCGKCPNFFVDDGTDCVDGII